MQPEISKKKSKSHQEQEIKKALVSRKLQENQRKYVQKEIKKTKTKTNKQTNKQKKQMKIEDKGWMRLKSNKKIQKV